MCLIFLNNDRGNTNAAAAMPIASLRPILPDAKTARHELCGAIPVAGPTDALLAVQCDCLARRTSKFIAGYCLSEDSALILTSLQRARTSVRPARLKSNP